MNDGIAVYQVVYCFEDALCVAVKRLSLLGDLHTVVPPVQQCVSQLRFELCNLVAQGGLCDMQRQRCT